MKQRTGKNKCFKCGKPGHFKRECSEQEREHRETIPLMTFEEEQGSQGLFYIKESHSEPLINLEVGPQCKVVTFLIDSSAFRSSLCLLPRGLIHSSERLLVSGVKRESFPAQILQETNIYFQNRTAKIQFLLVPEAGTNLFGRDPMSRKWLTCKKG
jgi:hypothetical protein